MVKYTLLSILYNHYYLWEIVLESLVKSLLGQRKYYFQILISEEEEKEEEREESGRKTIACQYLRILILDFVGIIFNTQYNSHFEEVDRLASEEDYWDLYIRNENRLVKCFYCAKLFLVL